MAGVFQSGVFQSVVFQITDWLSTSIRVQARLGHLRLGSGRLNYFVPNPVILINGVDQSESIQPASLSIAMAINDEADTASFTVPAWTGLVPATSHTVQIGLGDSENRIFAGQVLSSTHTFESDGEDTPWVDVECIDWSRLANRRLITGDFSGQTVAAIALIIAGYASGFTTRHIDTSLTTGVDEFICLNEEPTTAMRRVLSLIGGGFYIDAYRDWHVFGPGGETGSGPIVLAGGSPQLRTFRHTLDDSQIRTRAIVEGRPTKTLASVGAGVDAYTYGIPIEYGWMFSAAQGSLQANVRARIGGQVLRPASRTGLTGFIGPVGAEVTAPASAGATSITVGSNIDFPVAGWARHEDVYFFVVSPYLGGVGSSTVLNGIPSSGYGSLPVDLPVGAAIYGVDALLNIEQEDSTQGLVADVEAGEAVVVRVVEDDLAAQAAVAAIEGGDGIHEYFVSDPELSYAGAEQRALAELAAFQATLPYASWETTDMNALVGRPQLIAVTQTGGLSTIVTIQRVTLTFPHHNGLPLRACEGGTVKLQGLFEEIRG